MWRKHGKIIFSLRWYISEKMLRLLYMWSEVRTKRSESNLLLFPLQLFCSKISFAWWSNYRYIMSVLLLSYKRIRIVNCSKTFNIHLNMTYDSIEHPLKILFIGHLHWNSVYVPLANSIIFLVNSSHII